MVMILNPTIFTTAFFIMTLLVASVAFPESIAKTLVTIGSGVMFIGWFISGLSSEN